MSTHFRNHAQRLTFVTQILLFVDKFPKTSDRLRRFPVFSRWLKTHLFDKAYNC